MHKNLKMDLKNVNDSHKYGKTLYTLIINIVDLFEINL